MSTSRLDGGHPQGQVTSNDGGFHGASSPPEERPPICFNCGNEGHFVIACPEPIRSNLAPLAQARAPEAGAAGGGRPAAGFQKSYLQNVQNGAVVTHYQSPRVPPVITRYPVPQAAQWGGGSYGSPAPPYQQYGSPGMHPQGYPAQVPPAHAPNSAYPPQQSYGFQGQMHNQPHLQTAQATQAFAGTSMNYQYSPQGYQPPPYGQYNQYSPQHAAPQYGNQFPQQQSPQFGGAQYGETYQQPPTISHQSQGYGENYRRPSGPGRYNGSPNQWNHSAPPTTSQTSPNPQRQQSMSSQHDGSYHREFSGTPSLSTSAQEHGGQQDGHQQTPQTAAGTYNQQQTRRVSHHSSTDIPEASPISSRASTPYGRYGSMPNGTTTELDHDPTPFCDSEADGPAKRKVRGEDGEDKEAIFKWEFKKIFKEPERQETVALAQPLSTTFDMTPVPLLDSRSTNSVSRYARKENLKEFVRTIRNSPQWSYLKEDPAFADSDTNGGLIPLRELPAWMAARHGTEDVLSSRWGAKKRAWSDEQEDVDNQIKLESAFPAGRQSSLSESRDTEPLCKRQRSSTSPGLQSDSRPLVAYLGTPTAVPGTPIYIRDGSASCATEDDVWAPQPGEVAESIPADPTEALLASLGVSGSPKPVIPEPVPLLMAANAEQDFQPPELKCRSSSFFNHSSGISPLTQPAIPPPPPRSMNPSNYPYSNHHHASPQYGNDIPSHSPGSNSGPHHHLPYSDGSQGYSHKDDLAGHNQYPPRNQYYNSATAHRPYGPPLNTQFGNNGQNNQINRPSVSQHLRGGHSAPPPIRQDSGYISAREFHSNGPGHDRLKRRNSQLEGQEQRPAPKRTSNRTETSALDIMAPGPEQNQDADADPNESPLSPTSAEILGKLLPPTDKNGKKDTHRQNDHAFKKKRQPVVAEAYSRRW